MLFGMKHQVPTVNRVRKILPNLATEKLHVLTFLEFLNAFLVPAACLNMVRLILDASRLRWTKFLILVLLLTCETLS